METALPALVLLLSPKIFGLMFIAPGGKWLLENLGFCFKAFLVIVVQENVFKRDLALL